MGLARFWRTYTGKPKEKDFVKAIQPDVLPDDDDREYLDADAASEQWREAETPYEDDKRTP